MTLKQKDKAEYEFMNNPKIKVFIGQIVACSVGLTLTAAHTLVFNSYSWIAAENKQAEDRIYRLNQKNDVLCIYQLFNDSISQNMFDKVMRKEIISNNVIKSENEK
jgi:SNF2 family DNA or RNA helicase